MREAVIVAATRTPVGRRNGVLAEVRADDLAADVLEDVVKRAGIEKPLWRMLFLAVLPKHWSKAEISHELLH